MRSGVSRRCALLRHGQAVRPRAAPLVVASLAPPRRHKIGARSLETDTNTSWGGNVRGLGHNNYLGKILNANVYDVAVETPLQPASSLSAATGNNVLIKREDLQPVYSFKIRGAYNKIASLTAEQLRAGIVACSAGNHAQGVALSASRLGVDAAIIMPLATPRIKVDGVRKLGGDSATVVLHGMTYDEAQAEAMRRVEEEGRTLIHPFDDPLVIAGQGTIGVEILKHMTGKPLHAIFVCCGGGGMLAGIAAYVKRVRPEVQIIGVEAEDAAGMTESLAAGKRVTLEQVGLFADGAAVRTVGAETFRVCHELVDEMVTVTTDEICAAIKDGFADTRCVLEPAGALAIAGLKRWSRCSNVSGKTLVAISSGANLNFDKLRFIAERADASETLLSVAIPEEPGSFRQLIKHLERQNVTEFSYRYRDPRRAVVLVSFQAAREGDRERTIRALNESGLEATDLGDNELAKLHVRHLAGGRSAVADELVYRFEFPERPGALVTFLDSLNAGWNVSLFHYRNHGADVGCVLAGIQVPPSEHGEFESFLQQLDYVHYTEEHNPVRRQFLDGAP